MYFENFQVKHLYELRTASYDLNHSHAMLRFVSDRASLLYREYLSKFNIFVSYFQRTHAPKMANKL